MGSPMYSVTGIIVEMAWLNSHSRPYEFYVNFKDEQLIDKILFTKLQTFTQCRIGPRSSSGTSFRQVGPSPS